MPDPTFYRLQANAVRERFDDALRNFRQTDRVMPLLAIIARMPSDLEARNALARLDTKLREFDKERP